MLLYDSFLGLNASVMPMDLQHCVLKRADLNFAMKKSIASYRSLGDSSRVSAYKYFLMCCEQALLGVDEVPLLSVVINYFSEAEGLNEQEACEKLTQLFCLSFNKQHDALSIASMGLAFVDRPKAFAAFLRYLLQREVTPEHILSTHLLQNYFRYYLSCLSQVNNPIEKLYQLLKLSEESLSLCDKVKNVCCEERGFSSYALDGSRGNPDANLTLVEFVDTALEFSANEDNLKTLHIVFDVTFCMGALYQWNSQKNNTIWVNTITQLFNQPQVVIKQLPVLVNRLHEQPVLQQALAQILNDSSLSTLVQRHVVGVLNLIPFCPKLVGMVQSHDLPVYFQTLRQQNTSGAALFSSLFALFNSVKNTNTGISSLVFDALLDAVHVDPYVLEDTVMLGKLRKFSNIDACINQKIRNMEEEFNAVIQTQTQACIENMDYIVIEDAWREVGVKIRHLEEIAAFRTTFPMDKYALYIQLARALLQHGRSVFDPAAFVQALQIEPLCHAMSVTPYERLLVELLTTIDDEKIRVHCIQILDDSVSRPWREFNYSGQSLFKKATINGNLGLIQWMEASKIKNQHSYDSLAMVAAYVSQWSVVSYFHVHHSLKKGTVDQLFQIATSQRALHIIPALWTGEYAMPHVTVIESQFKLAVQLNNLESIRCFIDCPEKPSDKIIKNAFNNAIALKHFDIAKAIAEGFSGAALQGAINQTLKNAARLNQCEVLNVLCTLSNNRPARAVIESALIGATRANKLSSLKQLVRFLVKPPRPKVVQKARDEACKRQFTEIEDYLSILSDIINVQNNAVFEKKTKIKKTKLLMITQIADNEFIGGPIKHAVSCSKISPLQQHGFFLVKTSHPSPKPEERVMLQRQRSL